MEGGCSLPHNLGGRRRKAEKLMDFLKNASLLVLEQGGAGGSIQVVADGLDFHFPARQ